MAYLALAGTENPPVVGESLEVEIRGRKTPGDNGAAAVLSARRATCGVNCARVIELQMKRKAEPAEDKLIP